VLDYVSENKLEYSLFNPFHRKTMFSTWVHVQERALHLHKHAEKPHSLFSSLFSIPVLAGSVRFGGENGKF
jgi:hypothetical protein